MQVKRTDALLTCTDASLTCSCSHASACARAHMCSYVLIHICMFVCVCDRCSDERQRAVENARIRVLADTYADMSMHTHVPTHPPTRPPAHAHKQQERREIYRKRTVKDRARVIMHVPRRTPPRKRLVVAT